MGRNRGKFSFPIPGRKSLKKDDNHHDYYAHYHNDAVSSATASTPALHSAHEWPSHLDEPRSKAHRVLGTSEPIHRSTSKQSSIPQSPGFMSITFSEASFGSELEEKASRAASEANGHQIRPGISRRASSNIMGHAYTADGRMGSDHSTASHHLHPSASNSTMRSHYDAKSSPLGISQQTSDSAVRDMALRRGKPQVVTTGYGYSTFFASPIVVEDGTGTAKKETRKGKPAKLDLSKLFPRPRTGEAQGHPNTLFSPSKMVNSPAAMSTMSEYAFPHPMTREPTPNPRAQVNLKPTARPHASGPPTPSSPVRKFKRDEYDNAKIHVRRPPKGVQHWFDALDEDSDEATESASASIHAPKAIRPNGMPQIPIRQASAGRVAAKSMSSHAATRSKRSSQTKRKDTFTHEDLVDVDALASPSLQSLVSTRTKASSLSKTNLQDSSVLSFSSSEDDCDGPRSKIDKVAVRKSLDIHCDTGEIIIGQAQALEVNSHRRPSAAQMSTRSSSTNAATIEVMYSPEPQFTTWQPHSRASHHSGSRRSSHVRQPSVIPEDDDARPKTAMNTPLSPSSQSVRSARTSASEPKPRSSGAQKLMAVTAEEEMLLELMRKKRASMAKKGMSFSDLYTEEQDKLQAIPTKASRKAYRTSGFLAEASPVRAPEEKQTQRAVSPLPPRGRPLKAHYDSDRSDRSRSEALSEPGPSTTRLTIPPHLPTPSEFSPIDLYPRSSSPTPTISVASPTTVGHTSPLPSPITPGLRAYEADVNVKVASSDTSTENDEVNVLDTGVIDPPSANMKPSETSHRRRRTASSGTDMSFPIPPTSGLTDLAPVSEGSSRPSSVMEQMPTAPYKAPSRMSVHTLSTNGRSSSRQSNYSQHSNHSHSSGHVSSEKRTSRRVSRQSSAMSMQKKRSSVSDDVLAAWGSLGGTY